MDHDLAIAGALSFLAMMPKAVCIGRSAKDNFTLHATLALTSAPFSAAPKYLTRYHGVCMIVFSIEFQLRQKPL